LSAEHKEKARHCFKLVILSFSDSGFNFCVILAGVAYPYYPCHWTRCARGFATAKRTSARTAASGRTRDEPGCEYRAALLTVRRSQSQGAQSGARI
jgi:hypothetical protein